MDHHLFTSKIKDLTLLYIEDDPKIQAYLSEFLNCYTSNLHLAQSAEQGEKLYSKINPDIILLDINLPGKSGIDFAREIRTKDKKTRIIISTAYTNKEFLLTAIELELTRYLVKPITSIELSDALIKAANEYSYPNLETSINLGKNFTYDNKHRILRNKEKSILLRKKEMQLLEFFIKHSKRTISYEELQYEVWEDTMMTKDAVRAQIRNLRKKSHPTIIKNINAIGYKLYEKEE